MLIFVHLWNGKMFFLFSSSASNVYRMYNLTMKCGHYTCLTDYFTQFSNRSSKKTEISKQAPSLSRLHLFLFRPILSQSNSDYPMLRSKPAYTRPWVTFIASLSYCRSTRVHPLASTTAPTVPGPVTPAWSWPSVAWSTVWERRSARSLVRAEKVPPCGRTNWCTRPLCNLNFLA